MPGVGDVITPRLTISTADGTTAAALTVRKPDGTSTAGTGETGSSGNTIWTADGVTLDTDGVWVFDWTVTGLGAGREPEYVIVVPAGAGLTLPAPLASIANLVARLGRELTAAELARAPGLLASASTKLRGFCRRTFAAATDAEVVLRPIGLTLRLPNTPVVDISLVEMIGTAGTVDRAMSVGEWAFDGIDKIELWPDPQAISGIAPMGTYANTFRVTYDHGLEVPEFIADMCCDVTLRTLTSPTQVAGLVSERIGQYSYQYGQFGGGQSPGPSVILTSDDKKALREAGFRRSAGTVEVRI